MRLPAQVVQGRKVQPNLVDTAGAERFKCLSKGFYRCCHGFVVVFDVTQPSSLKGECLLLVVVMLPRLPPFCFSHAERLCVPH